MTMFKKYTFKLTFTTYDTVFVFKVLAEPLVWFMRPSTSSSAVYAAEVVYVFMILLLSGKRVFEVIS